MSGPYFDWSTQDAWAPGAWLPDTWLAGAFGPGVWLPASGASPSGLPSLPDGFVFLLGADGAYLLGTDGAYLYGVAT